MSRAYRASAERSSAAVTIAVIACVASSSGAFGDQFYASVVTNYSRGTPFQRGFTDPSVALGPPHGTGDASGSFDVLNLGVSGSATFGFDTTATSHSITNGSGADFIVFENPFYPNGDSTAVFAELMFLQVSSDGQHFAQFKTQSNTPAPAQADPNLTINPANVSGFGGVHPVYANPDTNSINPFDPATAGGDAFDLQDLQQNDLVLAGQVDLNNIRYIRLIDVLGDGSQIDSYGNKIYDATGSGNGGADVDAISVINGVSIAPEPSIGVMVLAAVGVLMRRRTGTRYDASRSR